MKKQFVKQKQSGTKQLVHCYCTIVQFEIPLMNVLVYTENIWYQLKVNGDPELCRMTWSILSLLSIEAGCAFLYPCQSLSTLRYKHRRERGQKRSRYQVSLSGRKQESDRALFKSQHCLEYSIRRRMGDIKTPTVGKNRNFCASTNNTVLLGVHLFVAKWWTIWLVYIFMILILSDAVPWVQSWNFSFIYQICHLKIKRKNPNNPNLT